MAEDRIHVEVTGSAKGLQAAAAAAKRSVKDLGDDSSRETARAKRDWASLRASLAKPFKAKVEEGGNNVGTSAPSGGVRSGDAVGVETAL